MKNIFLEFGWTGPLLWLFLYISDYTLTFICARMYKCQNVIRIEGSYELNPMFQKDINNLKRLSPTFIFFLFFITLLLYALHYLFVKRSSDQEYYLFILGATVLGQLTIHIRHLHNWLLYRNCTGSNSLRGNLEYPRKLVYKISSLEFISFSILYLFIFLITYEWFILGGTITCFGAAFNHYRTQRNL